MQYIDLLRGILPLDNDALAKATQRQQDLIKPAGSLGELEEISIKIAGITGKVNNLKGKKLLVLFGADNGVYDEGISASPQHFTRSLMMNYAKGRGCAINVICRSCGVDLKLVDMGIKGGVVHDNVDNASLMPNGTKNFAKEYAMTRKVAEKAVMTGAAYAKYAVNNGYSILGNGEIGMANTTTATACIMAALGMDDAEEAVGRGGGLTDVAFRKKKETIVNALRLHKPDKNDAIDILCKVGGLDIAAMTGLYLGSAYHRMPIVIDGLISVAGALMAHIASPHAASYMIASHISEEPAYKLAIEALELKPILKLGMRLGEGSGCPIAMNVIDAALDIMNEMSTFDELAIETQYRENIKMK